MIKRIAVMGSTGSIGTQTLEVIKSLNKESFEKENREAIHVSALTAHNNIDLLEQQIYAFKPELAVIGDKAKALELKKRIGSVKTEILDGLDGLLEAATMDGVHTVVNALVGKAGLLPTIHAIKAKKHIALANKETLVMAGELVMRELLKGGGGLSMIDSEHTAVCQCLSGNEGNEIEKIYITASGGPFRGRKKQELENVTIGDALNHPNWSMGEKITVDSATLMNKGFEVIEAKWLYGVGLEKIHVLVHPQSIIHSMVEFGDGSIMAQLSGIDMRIPIQYALTGSARVKNNFQRLDFISLASLTFEAPDMENFPCLRLACDALNTGGTMTAVLNCANDMAVRLFLDGKISFNNIPVLIEGAMSSYNVVYDYALQDIMAADSWVMDYFRRKGVV